jgi:hypothetical protein
VGALALLTVVWLTCWLSFVDRDTFMRYQWGMGVGHVYAHATQAGSEEIPDAAGVQALDDFEELEGDVSGCGAGFSMSNLGGEESDSDWGSTSGELEASDVDSDEYYTLDYEN